MNKSFIKKETFKVNSQLNNPSKMNEPNSAVEFQRRGLAYYAHKQYETAEIDLKRAVLMDEGNIDSFYGLGMVLKALNRKDEAIKAFNQVLSLVGTSVDSNKTRNDMLRRLALGHINFISHGDWNLEKEIWQRIE